MTRPRTLARWTDWIARGFLWLAALALAAVFILWILIGTVWQAPKGCEECVPHITAVLGSLLLLMVSILFGIVGAALYITAQRLDRTDRSHAGPKRRT